MQIRVSRSPDVVPLELLNSCSVVVSGMTQTACAGGGPSSYSNNNLPMMGQDMHRINGLVAYLAAC